MNHETLSKGETMELREQRQKLTDNLANCEPGAFPGSREYAEESAAMKALADFDKQHPEVLADIRAERDARIDAANPTGYQN